MGSKIKIVPRQEETPEKAVRDTPLLDLSGAPVRELVRSAKKHGYVTHDQVNSLLSSGEIKSEQIEDILAKFSEMGVNVVEAHEADSKEEPMTRHETPEQEEATGEDEIGEVRQQSVPVKSRAKEPAERTDDPVRLYLREMASVELLSREGEIAIAKRVEAGREALIAGLCESPLTFQSIVIWRDELKEGKVLLRDIIDLSASYAGNNAKAMTMIDNPLSVGIAAPGQPAEPPSLRAPAIAPLSATPLKPPGEGRDGRQTASNGVTGESNFDDDDMEDCPSWGAIEAELEPKVVETFDTIAEAYKRLRRLQDREIQPQLKHRALSLAQERKY